MERAALSPQAQAFWVAAGESAAAVVPVVGLTGTPCLWSSFAQTNVERPSTLWGRMRCGKPFRSPSTEIRQHEGDGYKESG